MLTLWGRLNSINVQKVLWCLEALGLPYERRDAGGPFGFVDTPDYRSKNPNGLVPVIEEDAFVLWESNAIVRYLAAKHDEGGLWPRDLRVRADADRWMDWQTTTFTPGDAPGLPRPDPHRAGEAGRRRHCGPRSPSRADGGAARRASGRRAYVAATPLRMGDIAVGAAAIAGSTCRPARAPAEHRAWHRRLLERTPPQSAGHADH
jgi:glutathione S-transferase